MVNEQSALVNSNKVDKVQIYEEPEVVDEEKEFSINFLGEIIMTVDIGKTLNYNYQSAFRSISDVATKADYTAINLGTNIVKLDEIKDTSSKYIANHNILNAFNALGVDGVNLATDHMLDFGKDVFKDTKNILVTDYDLIGLKDSVVYIEHDGIKAAIIGVCNEVIGLQSNYTDAGLMMYNLKNLKSMIKEAKKNVNTVIVLTHLGLENTHTITDIMAWFYRTLIDYGADVVLGDHALGIYPLEIYKDKPIVYSMGYIMSDTNYTSGKQGGIFNITLDEKGYLKNMEITPLYINAKKQTLLYSDYDKEKGKKVLQNISKDLNKDMYTLTDEKLIVNLTK